MSLTSIKGLGFRVFADVSAHAPADATPAEITGVLTASGVWGVVYEPAESGPFNAHVLDDSPPILVNVDMFNALRASPDTFTVAGGEAGFGPTAVNVSLAEVRHLDCRSRIQG